jgi:hypothetical protein
MGVTISWSIRPEASLRKTGEEIWDLICPNWEIPCRRANRKVRRRAKA